MTWEEVKAEMTKTEMELWEAYAEENYDCVQDKDVEGMLYWSEEITKLIDKIKFRLSTKRREE